LRLSPVQNAPAALQSVVAGTLIDMSLFPSGSTRMFQTLFLSWACGLARLTPATLPLVMVMDSRWSWTGRNRR